MLDVRRSSPAEYNAAFTSFVLYHANLFVRLGAPKEHFDLAILPKSNLQQQNAAWT
jgi:hypothetical protein